MTQAVTEQGFAFDIHPLTDRAFLEELLRLRWSGGALMLRGKIIHPRDVEALAAYHDGKLAGVATWLMEGPVIYLATLNNISGQRGVGMALLEAMKEFGREKRAALLRVIVTNDNLNALGFYQRRGFRIIAVSPGAIDTIRSLMPNIPDIGANRIPIRDEIELEIAL
jgi:GNAT superfamily N-acetyltransferase